MKAKPSKRVPGELLLILTSIIWGTGFVMQRRGMDFVGPFTFMAVRLLLGSLTLLPFVLLTRSRRRGSEVSTEVPLKTKLRAVVVCGVVLFLAGSFQQVGIINTTAGKAAFITALYIVLVPVLGLIWGKRTQALVWLGVILAIIGLYLLSFKTGFNIGLGDSIVLAGAFFWALHILAIDHFNQNVDGLIISFGQFLVAGLVALIVALLREKIDLQALWTARWIILYAGAVVVGVAYTLQVLGQKGVNPSLAAIILSMESVFGLLSGMLFLGESMTMRELAGCALMLVAVIVAQWPGNKKAAELNTNQS